MLRINQIISSEQPDKNKIRNINLLDKPEIYKVMPLN